jgi:hypothetical protein
MAKLHDAYERTRVDPTGVYRTHAISGGGQKSNEWAPYFGVTNKDLGAGPYQRENYDLPDAYVGSNPFLSRVMIRTITDADTFLTKHVLPFTLKEDGDEISWDVLKFNNHLLNRRPEESVSRLVTTEKQEDSASFVTYGIAMSLESGFFRTAQGQQHYAMHLQQISNATNETAALGATLALLRAGDLTTNGILESNDEHLNDIEFRNKLQKERDEFGIFQTGRHGFEVISDRLRQDLMQRGVTAPTFTILPAGGLKYAQQTRPDCAQKVETSNMGVITESRPFILGEKRPQMDPFFRIRSIGSYYIALARDSESAGSKYNSSLRSIETWSEDDDDFHRHTLSDLIEASVIKTDGFPHKWFERAITMAPEVVKSLTRTQLESLEEIIEFKYAKNYTQEDRDAMAILEASSTGLWAISAMIGKIHTEIPTWIARAKVEDEAEDGVDVNVGRGEFMNFNILTANQVSSEEASLNTFPGLGNAEEVRNALAEVAEDGKREEFVASFDALVALYNWFSADIMRLYLESVKSANDNVETVKTQVAVVYDRKLKAAERLNPPVLGDARITATTSAYEKWLKRDSKPGMKRYLKFCDVNNLYCPASFFLFSPDMQFDCGTMMMGKGGSELGATFYGFADFQLGKNAAQKMLFGHFTVKLKSVVYNKELLVTANDVYIRKYIKGAGHEFNKPERFALLDDNRKDLYCIMVPPDWSPTSKYLDITGRFNPAILSTENRNEHVPGLADAAVQWGFVHTLYAPNREDGDVEVNTIVWQGAQRVTRCGTDNVISPHMIMNSGHLGNMYPGCGGIRRGATMYPKFVNYDNTVPQLS